MSSSAPEHFDAIAERYAASEVHAQSPTIQRLHELLGSGKLGSICDVACGPGHLALSFAGRASRIVGVDAAPNMLREFERLAHERGAQVETVEADVKKIPLPSGSFDAVLSRLAPHHFPDPLGAVREMARLAKPGGSVAVIDLQGSEDRALDELNHEIEVLHDPSHVRSYTAERWKMFFDTAGLDVVALGPGQTELPGGLSVQRWCEIGNTPKESQQKIRARLKAASAAQLAQLGVRVESAEYYIPVRTLIIFGRNR